ncbi:MAG: alpha/beta fold hydrolase [Verrucomicrobiales bacterium]|nr:alpha/beta fold hydrolase [Verrucomicrobiales bacterium]
MKSLIPLLLFATSLTLVGCNTYSKAKLRPISKITATGEQKALYQSIKGLNDHPRAQIGRYLDTANTARLQLRGNPGNTLARSDYNFAVSRIIEIIGREQLKPWKSALTCGSGEGTPWSLKIKPIDSNPDHSLDRYELRAADRYDFKGKLVGERITKEGLGAPLIAVAKHVNFKKVDIGTRGEGRLFYGLTAVMKINNRTCEIVLYDPLSKENIPFDGHSYPLAADFQAPLALALANLGMKKREISGMFKPTQHESSAKLATLQPYSPDKIPVLFIHGLGNSPATWAPMFDYLRNDEAIRRRYQFWFFSYPTGVPFPTTAAQLRVQLKEMRQRYPGHKDIVIIGHSLGGNITRLLVTDTGLKVWNQFYAKPPADIPFHPETRRVMSEALIFKAQPHIARVIFASASLGGSGVATSFIGKLGIKMIGNPLKEDALTEDALTYLRPEIRKEGKKHLPNSVEILNPDSKFLQTINSIPIKSGIPYHTLIGDQGKGGNLDHTEPVSTDSIVPYWSSHLDGAVSELVIPSKHWTILHPQGMAEIKRILKKY